MEPLEGMQDAAQASAFSLDGSREGHPDEAFCVSSEHHDEAPCVPSEHHDEASCTPSEHKRKRHDDPPVSHEDKVDLAEYAHKRHRQTQVSARCVLDEQDFEAYLSVARKSVALNRKRTEGIEFARKNGRPSTPGRAAASVSPARKWLQTRNWLRRESSATRHRGADEASDDHEDETPDDREDEAPDDREDEAPDDHAKGREEDEMETDRGRSAALEDVEPSDDDRNSEDDLVEPNKPASRRPPQDQRGSDKGRTPLIEAVRSRKLFHQIEAHIERCIGVDEPDGKGRTALLCAAKRGYVQAAMLLLLHTIQPDAADPETGENVLHHLANDFEGLHFALAVIDRVRGREFLKRMLDRRAGATGFTPLFVALANENLATFEMMLCYGADTEVEARHERFHHIAADGSRAIHLATQMFLPAFLCALIRHGADVNARASSGRTALHIAAERSYADLVQQLLLAGADPMVRTPPGTGKRDNLTALELVKLKWRRPRSPETEAVVNALRHCVGMSVAGLLGVRA